MWRHHYTISGAADYQISGNFREKYVYFWANPPITRFNIKKVVFSEIFVEILKAGGGFFMNALTDIFSTSIRKGKMPRDWKKTVNLYNGKTDSTLTDKYRGIRLFKTPFKLVKKIISNKLINWIESRIEQFLRGLCPTGQLLMQFS